MICRKTQAVSGAHCAPARGQQCVPLRPEGSLRDTPAGYSREGARVCLDPAFTPAGKTPSTAAALLAQKNASERWGTAVGHSRPLTVFSRGGAPWSSRPPRLCYHSDAALGVEGLASILYSYSTSVVGDRRAAREKAWENTPGLLLCLERGLRVLRLSERLVLGGPRLEAPHWTRPTAASLHMLPPQMIVGAGRLVNESRHARQDTPTRHADAMWNWCSSTVVQ